jgi:hypothetical protein
VQLLDLTGGEETEIGAVLSIGGDQYRFSLDTSSLTPGTKLIAAQAVDNAGNAVRAIVALDLNVVPFAVQFIDPIPDGSGVYELVAADSEFFKISKGLTVQINGIELSELASVRWVFSPVGGSETVVDASELALSLSEAFSFTTSTTVVVKATNTDGFSVESTLRVFPVFQDPVTDVDDFINYAYYTIRGAGPSQDERDAATGILGSFTSANQAALIESLLPNNRFLADTTVRSALVHKTLTGQWPSEEVLLELQTELLNAPEFTSQQSTETKTGSIGSGDVTSLTFDYSAGDEVTIQITGDNRNANSLVDPTLVVTSPTGQFVAAADDNNLPGFSFLDAVVQFTAQESGAYNLTIGGFSFSNSGDFIANSTVISTITDIAKITSEVLVRNLGDALYNGPGGFPTAAELNQPGAAPDFISRLYLNKHGVAITSTNLNQILRNRLIGTTQTSSQGYAISGYSGDPIDYAAAFAVDTDLISTGPQVGATTADGFPFTDGLFYGRPNRPACGMAGASRSFRTDY